ncbi:MAG: response regulator [Anaerolineae bacterium]|nr:MAG: response regulator [Anaerolineae bacterium]
MRILYLEDDPANLALFDRIAQLYGDEIITVAHPEDAIAELQSDAFDLIVADVYLGTGVMDGIEFAEHLRSAGLQTPIISITAYDFEEYERRSEEAGAEYHIVKPIAVNDLIAVINQFRA